MNNSLENQAARCVARATSLSPHMPSPILCLWHRLSHRWHILSHRQHILLLDFSKSCLFITKSSNKQLFLENWATCCVSQAISLCHTCHHLFYSWQHSLKPFFFIIVNCLITINNMTPLIINIINSFQIR